MPRINFFKIDKSYKVLHDMISERYGINLADVIFEQAETELAGLYKKYADLSAGERAHTDKYIFPRAAMFRAMKNQLGDDAMPLMDELIHSEGTAAGELMRKMTAAPFMERVFLKMFAVVAKKQFGETKGFKQKFYSTPKNMVKFDILDCPYCKYCRMCDCPELIHTFCDSDAYCFGNLSKIDFRREQTLEHGEKCDFTLEIKRK